MEIYGTYVSNGVKKRYLLAICPLLDESNHSTLSHYNTLIATIQCNDKANVDLLHMVGDNCLTVRKLAREYLHITLIGCYSHKLNLAVKNWLEMAYCIERISSVYRPFAASSGKGKIVHNCS